MGGSSGGRRSGAPDDAKHLSVAIAGDRWGRKRVVTIARVILLASIVPAFAWLTAAPDTSRLLVVAAVLTIPTVFISVTTVTMITEVFPRHIRATGLAMVYGLWSRRLGVRRLRTVHRNVANRRDRLQAGPGRLRYRSWLGLVCGGAQEPRNGGQRVGLRSDRPRRLRAARAIKTRAGIYRPGLGLLRT